MVEFRYILLPVSADHNDARNMIFAEKIDPFAQFSPRDCRKNVQLAAIWPGELLDHIPLGPLPGGKDITLPLGKSISTALDTNGVGRLFGQGGFEAG